MKTFFGTLIFLAMVYLTLVFINFRWIPSFNESVRSFIVTIIIVFAIVAANNKTKN